MDRNYNNLLTNLEACNMVEDPQSPTHYNLIDRSQKKVMLAAYMIKGLMKSQRESINAG